MTDRIRLLAGSHRVRIAVGYALVVVLLALAWGWSLYGPLTQVVVEQQRSHLRTIANASALAIAQADGDVGTEIGKLVARTDLRMTVVRSDGTVLADSAEDPARMENHADRPEIAAALDGRTGIAQRRSETLGVSQLYVAVPAVVGGERAAVRVSEELARIEQIAGQARQTGLALLAGAMLAAIAAGVGLSASVAGPVVRVRRAAERMAAGDLHAPVPEVPGELGDIARSLETLRDRVRATILELEAGQATTRAVIDGLQDAVLVLEGDTITLANPAASALFRAPASGWRGTPLAAAGLPASLTAEIGRLASEDGVRSSEIGPDPEQRSLRVTAVPLNPSESGRRTLVTVADITDRRRLDQVRRDFVANASHELKTPASSIQLLADAAGDAAGDGDTAQAMLFVSQMREEADRLRRLVLDLLDLSRLETAPQPGSITDMRAAVADTLAAHRAAAAAASLTVTVDESPVAGHDVYALAEPADVAVALDNLLANAIAYTDEGGVTVRVDATPETVSVTVADTGVGIAPEHLPRVFERFYRVDPSRTRASGGTGLGLALVRNAVERSGGTVRIESEPGGGTRITLTLPRAT